MFIGVKPIYAIYASVFPKTFLKNVFPSAGFFCFLPSPFLLSLQGNGLDRILFRNNPYSLNLSDPQTSVSLSTEQDEGFYKNPVLYFPSSVSHHTAILEDRDWIPSG